MQSIFREIVLNQNKCKCGKWTNTGLSCFNCITTNKMIKIYTQDLDGKHLIATVDQINQVEAYRECCRNIVTTEDEEQDQIIKDLPEAESLDCDALCISYGVDPRAYESALIVCGCIVIMPILLVIGYFMQ